MSISLEYLQLARKIADSLQIPAVSGIHLPSIVEDSEKPDEFGFVFLEDGSVGPFYTSLNDTLEKLWSIYPDGKSCELDTIKLIEYFEDESEALHAVALGAFNALSQHVMSRASYSPVEYATTSSIGFSEPEPGQTIGMVGYFKPLIENFLSEGIEVLVLEKNPDRVELQKGIRLSTNPADLTSCEYILCTASTLINGSLDEILAVRNNTTRLSLIGPSGSGLPDILFKHGVDAVGGIKFHDNKALLDALDKQEKWGHAGEKYQLTTVNYPGVSQLLKLIREPAWQA